jgi:hypothetical protein
LTVPITAVIVVLVEVDNDAREDLEPAGAVEDRSCEGDLDPKDIKQVDTVETGS